MKNKEKFVFYSIENMKKMKELESEKLGLVVRASMEEVFVGQSETKKDIKDKESIDLLNSILEDNKKNMGR